MLLLPVHLPVVMSGLGFSRIRQDAVQPRQTSQNSVPGMAIMAFCMLVLPGMDAIAKYLSTFSSMAPAQVAFYRFFVQFCLTFPLLVLVAPRRFWKVERPWINLLRGGLHAAATLLFFISVKYMPLADVFAIYFVEPFMLTGLSALFLGDKVGWRQWLAIAIGFGGAMVVIQPSYALFGVTSLLPVFCAFFFTLYLFLNRAVGEGDSPLTMQVLSGAGGSLFMGIVLIIGHWLGQPEFQPSLPAGSLAVLLLLVLGGLSGFAHLLVVKAFRMAPLSVLAPFQYFEIISATILGYALFGDFPSLSKWTGILIIILSGLYIIWRESQRSAVPSDRDTFA
jgi:drug/metabolite transporter (DMT)-like permease